MDSDTRHYRPAMTEAGLAPTHAVRAVDEYGDTRDLRVAGEFPLTIKVDDREVVTLMTLGTWPEALTLGYLRNQRLVENIEDIRSVDVDWDREQVNVSTFSGRRHRRLGAEALQAHRDHRLRPGNGVQLHPRQALRDAAPGGASHPVGHLRTPEVDLLVQRDLQAGGRRARLRAVPRHRDRHLHRGCGTPQRGRRDLRADVARPRDRHGQGLLHDRTAHLRDRDEGGAHGNTRQFSRARG